MSEFTKNRFYFSKVLPTSIGTTLLGLVTISSVATSVNGQEIEMGILKSSALADTALHYSPPSNPTPRPEHRDASGSRGKCNLPLELKLIVPSDHIPLTVVAHPTFLWYLSTVPFTTITFALIDPDSIEPLLEERMIPQKGVNELVVPPGIELQPYKQYKWSISVDCSESHPSENLYASAWVERVPASPGLKQKLKEVKGSDRAALYANSGIWYDAAAVAYQESLRSTGKPIAPGDFARLLEQVGLSIPERSGQLHGFVGNSISPE